MTTRQCILDDSLRQNDEWNPNSEMSFFNSRYQFEETNSKNSLLDLKYRVAVYFYYSLSLLVYSIKLPLHMLFVTFLVGFTPSRQTSPLNSLVGGRKTLVLYCNGGFPLNFSSSHTFQVNLTSETLLVSASQKQEER